MSTAASPPGPGPVGVPADATGRPLKLLHTADWQIGRSYSRFDPEHAPLLAEARLAAVERLAALAQQHAVDAVLVAGDVFDAQTVSDRTVRRLFQALAGFAGPWLLLPGNHDAALAESVWRRALRLQAVPAHVHLLLSPEPWVDPAGRFVVLPAPLTQRHTVEDLTHWFDAAESPPGALRIGLAHGSVQGLLAEEIDSANPIAADRAARARLDYLALGDWHGCKPVDARTWYAGTPEPDRFKDNGAGKALLVSLHAPGLPPEVQPLPVGRYRWQARSVALQVGSDVDGVIGQLQALGADDVVALEVSGRIDLAARQRLRAAIGQAEARARDLAVDLSGLWLEATDDELAGLQAEGYLGPVLAELRALQDSGGATGAGADAGLAREALALLADALQAVRDSAAPVESSGPGDPPTARAGQGA